MAWGVCDNLFDNRQKPSRPKKSLQHIAQVKLEYNQSLGSKNSKYTEAIVANLVTNTCIKFG